LTFNTGLTNTSFSQFAILQQGVRLSAKAFLQGPFNTNNNLMDDYHRSANLLPLTEPYTALGYINKESGGEKTTSNVLAQTGNDAIVDWIYIEFRDKNNTANRLYTRAALLQRDGDIVDMDGTSPVYFSTAEVDNYYIAIKHRNHYGIRTTNPIALSSTPVTLNFTNASVPVFGASPLYYVTTNILAMNAGDSNKDGSIDAFDTILWEYQNGLFDDYNYNADYNLDGSVDAFDSILWELNNGKFEELD
jgi:hypothetical protein